MKNPGEWWDKTWNVAVGCDMSLPCAEHCWARCQAHMHAKHPNPAIASKYAEVTDEQGRWTGQVTLWNPELEAPLHWRKPQVVAVSLMGDLFMLPDADLDRIYAVMALCPQHRFVVLTKRAERRYRWVTRRYLPGAIQDQLQIHHGGVRLKSGWPLPNVIEMISASTQAELDERWPWLAQTSATQRGLHLEPLVGPVDLSRALFHDDCDTDHKTDGWCSATETGFFADWVVVGGETGLSARPMHPDWVRKIRDQCQAAGVPFWFKSHGEWLHETQIVGEAKIKFALGRLSEPRKHTWPDGSVSWRVGRLL